MIGRTIQWEGCATHLELELCCMDVFSVKVRQYCTAVSGDSRHHHDRIVKAKKRHLEKKKKSTVFLSFFTWQRPTAPGLAAETYATHINTRKRETERPAEGPHIPLTPSGFGAV